MGICQVAPCQPVCLINPPIPDGDTITHGRHAEDCYEAWDYHVTPLPSSARGGHGSTQVNGVSPLHRPPRRQPIPENWEATQAASQGSFAIREIRLEVPLTAPVEPQLGQLLLAGSDSASHLPDLPKLCRDEEKTRHPSLGHGASAKLLATACQEDGKPTSCQVPRSAIVG
eukprot:s37_g4.t2